MAPLVLAYWLGDALVVGLLVLVTSLSLILVGMAHLPLANDEDATLEVHVPHILLAFQHALRQTNFWLGLLFALLGGASFKSLEVIIGPLLIDRGFAKSDVGLFASGPMIVPMVAGAYRWRLAGGSGGATAICRAVASLHRRHDRHGGGHRCSDRRLARPLVARAAGRHGTGDRPVYLGFVRHVHGYHAARDRRDAV